MQKRTKNTFVKTAGLALIAGILLSSCGSDTTDNAGQSHNWNYASAAPSSGALGIVADWWAEEVKERSDGNIEIETFQDSSLLSATDTLSGVIEGRADFGYLAPAFYENELPLTSATTIPFTSNDSEAVQRAMYQMYQENDDFRAEYTDQGLHVLFFLPLGGSVMGFEQPITDISQLKGMRVRAVGLHAEAFDAAGAEPIYVDPSELYENIQRGVVDGFGSLPFDLAETLRLGEVAPEFNYPGLGTLGSAAVVMRQADWDALDEETQTLLTEIAEETMTESVTKVVEVEEQICTDLLDSGAHVSILDQEQVDQWDQLEDWHELWLDKVADAGTDRAVAQQFLDEYLGAVESFEGQGDYIDGAIACAER